ncbi:uncharacterized protein LOC124887759 [Capsicum annuum]|uniref:uncharacterized protein LOC124887759 n=1 Tax=Capsicum annuum TaxID=4072 RepID=UPI001FB13C8E|nr:uncharacterized protein LOC124887759 [Capsicum annuum]
MALFEALYGRRCRSLIGWFEVDEATVIGPNAVFEAMEKVKLIRKSLKTSQSHQKSYKDVRRRFLEVLHRVGKAAYEIELPAELSAVYPVFNVCMLKKHIGDYVMVASSGIFGVRDNLTYDKIPVEILDYQMERTRVIAT